MGASVVCVAFGVYKTAVENLVEACLRYGSDTVNLQRKALRKAEVALRKAYKAEQERV